MSPLKIGQVARDAGVTVDTVRFYERRGVLPAPEREPSGYRRYSEEQLRSRMEEAGFRWERALPVTGQAGALRMGIARCLCKLDPDNRPSLAKAGMMTRDPRMVERKKYGQSGARKRRASQNTARASSPTFMPETTSRW